MERDSQVKIGVETEGPPTPEVKEYFFYKLGHQKNRVPVPRFCKRLWALQLSELAHLAWADPIMGFGSE